MDKILVVVAHPDDEILGVGGTLAKHIDNGDEVYCLILGEGMTSRNEKREEVEQEKLEELHTDTLKAAEIIGFQDVFFSDFPDNRFDGIDLLDIIKEVEEKVNKIEPDIIYTHYSDDLNIDHQRTFKAVITACRPVEDYTVKEIYAFETPSSTEWNFNDEISFNPNVFVDVKKTIDKKLRAMECYKSEVKDYPHPRSIKALRTFAKRWGTVVGKEYVEAFELVRQVKN
ncbi:PIG-L family deacetylase [Halanaerocella petrolearia]